MPAPIAVGRGCMETQRLDYVLCVPSAARLVPKLILLLAASNVSQWPE